MNPIELLKLLTQWHKIQENYEALQKEGKMLSVGQILRSRTVWMIVFTVLFNGWQSVNTGMLDPHIVQMINGTLGLLAVYFRVKPAQK
jgi:hypothetical protein